MTDGRPALLHLFEPRRRRPSSPRSTSTGRRSADVDPAELVTELGERVRVAPREGRPADDPPSAMVAVGDGADRPRPACSRPARAAGTSSSSTAATPTCSTRSSAATTTSSTAACLGAPPSETACRDRRCAASIGRQYAADAEQARLRRSGGVRRRVPRAGPPSRRRAMAIRPRDSARRRCSPIRDRHESSTSRRRPVARDVAAGRARSAGKGRVQREAARRRLSTEATRLVDAAADRRLRLGCAPDTSSAPGFQTCRVVDRRGLIGEPLRRTASCSGRVPTLAPEPGLLPARRGSAARHGSLLPHRARATAADG